MARNAEITLDFADGTYRFRLGAGELELLQEETDVGPYVLADRLRTRARALKVADGPIYGYGDETVLVSLDGEANPPAMMPPECSAKEIRTVIRLGLIGGGMKSGSALKLVKNYVEAAPPEDHRFLAWAIMQTALYGAPEESVGEHDAPDQSGETSSTISPTEN